MIELRGAPVELTRLLHDAGVHPVLARLLSSRGLRSVSELSLDTTAMLDPADLAGIGVACGLLADAIARGEPMAVVADYDCDGATACATMIRGLRSMGAHVDYVVPNRFIHGYGLTPPIVDLVIERCEGRTPRLLITVDNGIASIEGVAYAQARGIGVVVTDHHLPGSELPGADAIVNPNQPDCGFASKNLAGVGVAFYVLIALRAELRRRGWFESRPAPALQRLLDLVALGTVADVVRLDRNNRILVAAGLRRIRGGGACAGIQALLAVAGRTARDCSSMDLGFAVGPRINAAGRLEDISLGIECLLADDPEQAAELAARLDGINRERRSRELDMRDQALADLDSGAQVDPRCAVLMHRDWHEGIVGLVASRIKDRLHRPTFAFAPSAADPDLWRGSGRSISGVHLRDALDRVSKRHPGLIERFGGHAMAAGLTLRTEAIDPFRQAIAQAVDEMAEPGCFSPTLLTDGPLAPEDRRVSLVELLQSQVWGQGFPEPVFSDEFDVLQQRRVKERHLKLTLGQGRQRWSAIWFDRAEPLPAHALIAYRLMRDDWSSPPGVQLQVVAADY